jgi:mannose-1-phosphate guanylyltransferase
MILEPASRNTAPSIALGIKYCMERLGCKEDEVIFISPSDHIIKPVDRFVEYINLAGEVAQQGYIIVTFGIKPDRPVPDISIDYAVMEKSDKVVTLPMDLYWNDIGSWDSLYDVLDKDENGNIKMGDILTLDTKNTLIIGNKRLISTIGLEDCLIVETDDAILVAKKGETQKSKGDGK